MPRDTNLEFITDKINQVRSAIMYSLSDDLIRLPNSIVNAVKVDEEGQLWFMCDRPLYLADQLPESFPVRLHFYRKGKMFHLEVSGAARIVKQADEANAANGDGRLLIQMDMKNITYKETEEKKPKISSTVNRAYQWVMRHTGLQSKPLVHSMTAGRS